MLVDGHTRAGNLRMEDPELFLSVATEIIKQINVVPPRCSYLFTTESKKFNRKALDLPCQKAMH
jgi:hypothetical protein